MTVLLDVLAVHRITRLITRDRITERPREALSVRSPFADELLHCPWCVSMWVAAGVMIARSRWPRRWAMMATVLAASTITGSLEVLTTKGET